MTYASIYVQRENTIYFVRMKHLFFDRKLAELNVYLLAIQGNELLIVFVLMRFVLFARAMLRRISTGCYTVCKHLAESNRMYRYMVLVRSRGAMCRK